MPLRRTPRVALAAALLALAAPSAAHAATSLTEAESLTLPAAAGAPFADTAASGGRALQIWTNGTATGHFTATAPRRIVVRARGDQCAGAPHMTVAVDGRTLLGVDVAATAWTDYGVDAALASGDHTLSVGFTNDAYVEGSCDRNLRVDSVTVSSTAGWPFAGRRFYVDPSSPARAQANAWRLTRPADALELDKIASQPAAAWFTGSAQPDIATAVGAKVSAAAAAGAVPVLVAYDIPQRDCGSYSAGGAGSADAYKTWIRGFAAGIGSRRAAVILEPDALAGIDCLSATDRARRLDLLRDAVSVLTALPGVSVYLDGGHSAWHSASEMASRLTSAGVADAQGFALNVSNFRTSADSAAYGAQIAALTGGKHFVVDTSRNGLGPAADGAWCSPAGRALGPRPTPNTGVSRQDANLWIKVPGESDGTCNGGPSAGVFWPDYALGLAQRAAY